MALLDRVLGVVAPILNPIAAALNLPAITFEEEVVAGTGTIEPTQTPQVQNMTDAEIEASFEMDNQVQIVVEQAVAEATSAIRRAIGGIDLGMEAAAAAAIATTARDAAQGGVPPAQINVVNLANEGITVAQQESGMATALNAVIGGMSDFLSQAGNRLSSGLDDVHPVLAFAGGLRLADTPATGASQQTGMGGIV